MRIESIVPGLEDECQAILLLCNNYVCVIGTQDTGSEANLETDTETSFFVCNWRTNQGTAYLISGSNAAGQICAPFCPSWANFSPCGTYVIFRQDNPNFADPKVFITELIIPEEQDMYSLGISPLPEPVQIALLSHQFICFDDSITSYGWIEFARIVRTDDSGDVVIDIFANERNMDTDSDIDSDAGDYRMQGNLPGTVHRFTLRCPTSICPKPEVEMSTVAVSPSQFGFGSKMSAAVQLYPGQGYENRDHYNSKALLLLAQEPNSLSKPRWIGITLPEELVDYPWMDIHYLHFDIARARLLMTTDEGFLYVQY
ncbi:hypothetical protein SISNIDRAFT_489910 [Sistotremastrum niveocremeum HHB9708]|uniref:Uncharacterized protein n=1 Tax=Sistotremastrum niveocremeum HHB9708 TaxID=1314777 RepID=A0A164PF78_9AGAM|nr:hypothetical protein SISNIDRAFT_489910 [Sistotremastrum niveocremeum HHB9708]